LSIEEDAQIDIRFDLFNRKVKKKDIIIFCKLFYTMLNAGINISKSLELIAENIKNLKLKFSIKEINKDIYKGSSLSDAMDRQKDIFSTMFVEMIKAGEISGELENIILRLEDYYDKQNKIENKIK